MNRSDTSAAPIAATAQPRWPAGRVAALAIGTLLVLVGLALLAAGGTALWADRTQRDGGYVTSGAHEFSTSGSALVTEETELGSAGVGWLYGPGLLGKVRIRVTPRDPSSRLFVGIGRSAAVDRYLTGVGRTVISEFFKERVEPLGGGKARSAPATQNFWAASTTGAGPQTVLWKPSDGSWKVVVMNADARPAVYVDADLGARFSALPWIALGVLIAGALFAAGGGLVIAGAIRRRRPLTGDDVKPHKEDVMQNIDEAASAFLANRRVAVTGVSRTPKTHGNNSVYKRLRERGYEVFAVNPNADQVEGDRAYPDLDSIPGGVDAVVIGTRPETADQTMRECAELGIKHVWMHWGSGASSVSPAATAYGREHGITVIDGGCPLMFGPTADFGHKIMRVALTRRVPKQV